MARRTTRSVILSGGSAALSLALAACGTSGPSNGGSGDGSGALAWALTGGSQTTLQASAQQWNGANSTEKIDMQFFQNDPYKQKLRVGVGSGNGPVLFENWGGGALKDYVAAGKVADLTPQLDADPAWKGRLLPSVLRATTFNGKVYGVPINGVQPVVLYFNKQLFRKVGAQPPKTWDDLLALVAKFKAAGIAPLSIGGASKWPDLMWLEYLTDRIGGPQVFQNIADGKPGAWSQPAVLKAATMIKQLVDAGAFAKGFASVTEDTGQPEAELYTGKAAMQLMGSWAFATIQTGDPAFVSGGHLGWTGFPSVSGGTGDPTDVVGNPSNFFSLSAQASAGQKKAAVDYLSKGVFNDSYIDSLLKDGNVPPVKGLDAKIHASAQPDWNGFVYQLTLGAKSFQLSWDQALSPSAGDTLLTNLDQLFLGQISPQQFCAAMDKATK